MNLPSVKRLYLGFFDVIKRFPLQFICAVTATVCWCLYIYLSDYTKIADDGPRNYLLRVILISNLALALLLASDLFSESKAYNMGKKWLLRAVALAVCVLLFFLLNPVEIVADAYRMALLAFAFHLLVAFSAFTDADDIGAFWEFNKILFLRSLTSALYSIVLFAGLSIALFAVKGLFNVNIEWKTYMVLFAIITAGFNTIFFLAGVPKDVKLVGQDQAYPKGLKIFTQFVLIPLMSVYLAILLVYELKILVSWELPKGLVSSLILGYAVFGILSLLLVYPIRTTQGNSWIKLFSKFFYVMLIPLIMLLMLAIWKRVSLYGITESRYILVALALWLAGITIYFLISKKDNIKIIPVSLCLLTLVTCYGPQSASSVSKNNQLSRLEKSLKSDKKNERLQSESIIRYIVTTHGLEALQPLTKKNLYSVKANIINQNTYKYVQRETLIDSALSVLKAKESIASDGGFNMTFLNDENEVLRVTGYDYVVNITTYPNPQLLELGGKQIAINSNEQLGKVEVAVDDVSIMKVDVQKLFNDASEAYRKGRLKKHKLKQHSYYPAKLMKFTKTSGSFEYTIVITSIQNTYYSLETYNKTDWGSWNSFLLVKRL